MRRNEIKLTNEKVIQELKRERLHRQSTYPALIEQGKISRYLANERYLTIDKLLQLMQLADRKGYTLEGLISELDAVKVQHIQQGKLFNK